MSISPTEARKAVKKQIRQIERSLRFRVLRKLFPGRPQTVRIHGLKVLVRPGSPDLETALQNLGQEFDPVAEILHPDFDGLIVDAGGYIGTAAVQLARMFPKATIMSVEPSSSNFAMLTHNVQGRPNIRPIKAALVPVPSGPLSLSDRGTGNWGFTILSKAADKPDMQVIEQVPTITLPELCERAGFDRIGFLKLDIEGAEKALFDSDPDLSGMNRVEGMMVEVHDKIIPGTSDSLRAFAAGRTIVKTMGDKYLLKGHSPG